MGQTTWRGMTAAAAALAIGLVSGCSAPGADGAADPAGVSHTMSDGTVMDGPMSEMDHEGHGRPAEDSEAEAVPDQTGPSPAARMVCSGDVVDDVARILALETLPSPTSSWSDPMFTCTYHLAEGPLVLSVHDTADEAAGKAHFDQLRSDLGDTTSLKGMYGLGLPAYETETGTVVFIKDGKTLHVDATTLPGNLGPDDDMSQTDLAYAVATSVLACWTEHA